MLKVGYADAIFLKSKGGVTPSGWSCEHLPYLVEFDNFGRSNPGKPSKSPFIWGWDEITWFALLPEAERNDWLRYAWKWVKETDPDGHLQMPGSRVMTPGKPDAPRWYWANTQERRLPPGVQHRGDDQGALGDEVGTSGFQLIKADGGCRRINLGIAR